MGCRSRRYDSSLSRLRGRVPSAARRVGALSSAGLLLSSKLADRARCETPTPGPPPQAGEGKEGRKPGMTPLSSPRGVLDQPPVKPYHVGIAFEAKALVGAVEALQIVRIRAHRREPENGVDDGGVVARVGGGDHQDGGDPAAPKNFPD